MWKVMSAHKMATAIVLTRKHIVLGVCLLFLFIGCFLVGGIIAPPPNSVINPLTVKCVEATKFSNKSKWFVPRGGQQCKMVTLHDEVIDKEHIEANQIAFAQWIPLPRDGQQLDMSRWFQNMIGVLQLDITYNEHNPMGPNPVLTMELRLGYRYKYETDDDWKELATAKEERPLDCTLEEGERENGEHYHCELLPLFELGSVHYDYYLINIRLPITRDVNQGIGQIEDIFVTTIFQNGGFTKVWFWLKTVLFVLLLVALFLFWYKIRSCRSDVCHRLLLCLGLVLTCLNAPIEWFTLIADIPAMGLINSIRQVAFYIILMAFCAIFVDQFRLDRHDVTLRIYWKALVAIITGGCGILVFRIVARAFPLMNPFYVMCPKVTLGFTIFFCILAALYFVFLCYMVVMTIRSMRKTASKGGLQLKNQVGMEIWLPRCLMLATLLCAALTVIFFIISQVSEGHWKWGDDNTRVNLEYTSAFLTGVYGMWNVYVMLLMLLLAPPRETGEDDTGLVMDRE